MDPLSDSDRDNIVRTILSEAGNSSPQAQAAVAAVIRNRVAAGNYGDGPTGVVLARGQFEPWGLPRGDTNSPLRWDRKSPEYKQAGAIADAVWSGRLADPTGGATHFYDPTSQRALGRQAPDWAQGQPMARVGPHLFYAPNGAVNVPQSDVLDRWGVTAPQSSNASPAAPVAQPEDIFTRWGVSQPTGKEPVPEASEPPLTAQEARTAVQRGLPAQMLGGVPILGPTVNMLQAAGSAAMPRLGESGDFESRFFNRLNEQRRADAAFAAANPISSAAASLGGGALATIPFGMTAFGARALGMEGSTLGSRVYQGVFGQGAIGGVDAALRGEDPQTGVLTGAVGGLVGPYAGEGVQGLARLYGDVKWPAGPLKDVGTVGRNFLVRALEGETSGSLAEGQLRAGPAGFLGDVTGGLTDVTGALADISGPQKTVIREAYRQRAADTANRMEGYLTSSFGQKVNIEDFKNAITENRAAAADPLYEQWRSMQVHPTQALKDLMPRLEKSGALDEAEYLSGVTGRPMNRAFFTPGPQKEYPTTETWDLVKRGLDSMIERAYDGSNNTRARALVGLKNEMIDEIEKTPAGQVWRQARQEFADRSALLDQIKAGRDTFLGSRGGQSVDEMREELRGLSQPELAARLVGARSAAEDTLNDTATGESKLRGQFLARNNQEKLRMMLGDGRANDLIANMESERFLANQGMEVIGNKATGASAVSRKERVNALQAPPLEGNWWNRIDLTKPATLIPPHLSPLAVLEGAQGARYSRAYNELAPLLTLPANSSQAKDVLTSIGHEATNRARMNDIGARIGNALVGLISGAAPATARNMLSAPAGQ